MSCSDEQTKKNYPVSVVFRKLTTYRTGGSFGFFFLQSYFESFCPNLPDAVMRWQNILKGMQRENSCMYQCTLGPMVEFTQLLSYPRYLHRSCWRSHVVSPQQQLKEEEKKGKGETEKQKEKKRNPKNILQFVFVPFVFVPAIVFFFFPLLPFALSIPLHLFARDFRPVILLRLLLFLFLLPLSMFILPLLCPPEHTPRLHAPLHR